MKKKIILIVMFSVVFATLFSSQVSGRLKCEMRAKINAQNNNERSDLIKNSPSLNHQLIFLHFSNKPSNKEINLLKSLNVEVFEKTWIPPLKNHPTGFMEAKIPVDFKLLNKLSTLKFIKRITSAERTFVLHNDLAAIETGVSQINSSPYNLTGEGVKIAVIDSGFEIDNPDIPEPLVAVDYSNYIAEPDSDFTVGNETTHTGHGTHVAGTILGQGTMSNGIWKGMAPDADFIALKVSHDNTGAIYFESLVHSVYAASFYYGADFINMSLGGWDEYHDGSSEDSQVVDLAYENGTISFISTGNDADKNFHYSSTIEPMGLSDYIAINYFDSTNVRSRNYDINLVWYDGPNTEIQKELDMVFYNEDFEPLTIQNVEEMTQSPRGTQSRYGTATVFGNNPFYVRILNQSESELTFHLYIDSQNGQFAQPDSNYTIATPACADKAISVGSYCDRINWVNWQGLEVGLLNSVLQDLAPYSNRGPRIDNVMKPTVTAPGTGLISVRDNDAWGGPPFGLPWDPFVVSNSYATGETSGGLPADYMYLSGTSMASPAACGSAALIKEYLPNLSNDELVELIKINTKTDEYTLDTPNPDWGYGKINVANIIQNLDAETHNIISKSFLNTVSNFPNPFNPETTISFNLSTNSNVNIKIFNLKGEIVKEFGKVNYSSGKHNIKWDGSNNNGKKVSSGVYFYKIMAGNQTVTKKMLLLK